MDKVQLRSNGAELPGAKAIFSAYSILHLSLLEISLDIVVRLPCIPVFVRGKNMDIVRCFSNLYEA